MTWVKRWVVMMALGDVLVGPTGCVVAPVEPGYVVSPPVVVIPSYRPHRYYYDYPYRHYRPYRPYHGWHRQPYR
jgi:hypothetical protein